MNDFLLSEYLKTLIGLWERETAVLSSISSKVDHPAYREIVRLGEPAIPHIVNRLRIVPGHLFLALHEITGQNPTTPDMAGRIQDQCDAWIEWFENRKTL